LISIQNGSSQPIANDQWLLDRGYTGHEHLQSVGLIHMNGRLYDPKLHRFLQPDNFVQDPTNTQNYNRYGYVLNNPLKYTDYSGEKWKITWSDIVSGVAIVGGAFLCFTPLAAVGAVLIGAGVAHFGAALNEFKQTGDWASASNNAGFIVSFTTKTDWGYDSKSDKNGIAQNDPVVKPIAADDVRNMSSGGGKGNGTLDNVNQATGVAEGIYGSLSSITASKSQGYWLGNNGKYYSTSWGGNQYTGSRAGAFEAAGNYKFAGNLALVGSAGIGIYQTYGGYQMDGNQFGYNAQRAVASSAGGIVGGMAGGWAGAQAGAAMGVWFEGVGAIPGAIFGFIAGYYGGQVGSAAGEGAVDYYHNKR
jgi:RHS repeat-associated protein